MLKHVPQCVYVQAQILLALVRASSLCIRGSRVEYRSGLGFDDHFLQSFISTYLLILLVCVYNYCVCLNNNWKVK